MSKHLTPLEEYVPRHAPAISAWVKAARAWDDAMYELGLVWFA